MVEVDVRRDPDVVEMENEHWYRGILLSFASSRWQILNLVKERSSKYMGAEIQVDALAGFVSQHPQEVVQMIIPPGIGIKERRHATYTFPQSNKESRSHDGNETFKKLSAPSATVNLIDKSTSTQMETEADRRDDIDPDSDETFLTKDFDAKSPAEKKEDAPAAPSPATSPPPMEPLKPTHRLYEKSDIHSRSHLYDRRNEEGVSSSACNHTDQSCSDFDSSLSSVKRCLCGSSSASTIALNVQSTSESPTDLTANKSAVEDWGERGKWELPEYVDARSVAPVGSMQMDMEFHGQELYQVQLLRFNNPNEVFVVPYLKTRESLNIRLRRWFADESKSRNFVRIRTPDFVHPSLPVMVMSNNYCRRAVVQEVNVQMCSVTIWLVDFGEKQTNVKLSSLLFMPRVFAEIPAQVMKFSLGASHYNDSDESITRMQDIAKHFTYSYMQVNCDQKYVDFILRDKGYGQSSSLRHQLVALSLASFDDISQSDIDEMSDIMTLERSASVISNGAFAEGKTDVEIESDRTPRHSPSSSPQNGSIESNGVESTANNVAEVAEMNPFSSRALLPPVPRGKTRISVRDVRRQHPQSSTAVSTAEASELGQCQLVMILSSDSILRFQSSR
ncbi:tudor domain protein [Ancylostoma caninum]|uniref:Tudor domain protein n=1 Tax=Ancylostoma caninum TaxID=29170 RepID=A0A368GBR6_ANCCA|nr:tudor domain protein [Ancylostoma caninum]